MQNQRYILLIDFEEAVNREMIFSSPFVFTTFDTYSQRQHILTNIFLLSIIFRFKKHLTHQSFSLLVELFIISLEKV